MAQVTVRNLEEEVKARLKRRAVLHGYSLEEMRRILWDAVKEQVPYRPGLGSRIAARFVCQGLAEDLTELRGQPTHPADFAPEGLEISIVSPWDNTMAG